MTVLQAIALGVLQGITEFLPISSSGHLVLAERLLGFGAGDGLLTFDVLLHLSTLVALVACYPRMWVRIGLSPFTRDRAHLRLLGLLLLGTIPGAMAGLLLEDTIEVFGREPRVVALGFLVTACVLVLGERVRAWGDYAALRPFRSIAIGAAQACALLPGLSRSGLTISAGRAAGLSRPAALDFSFLLAVPIIAGAALVAGIDVWTGEAQLPPLVAVLAGMITSFFSSVAAILWLRRFVASRSLAWFAPYLLFAAAGSWMFLS